MISKDFIKTISTKVGLEYTWDENENDDYGPQPINPKDSFGDFYLRTHCEPEDAIWYRELSDNFYTGLEVGIRNTLKVLKENPSLIEQLTKE